MARTVVKLDEEEVKYFHLNYAYMWKKLNTAPYYVSGAGEIPKWIHEQWLLPSYANLSKCLNMEYVPSMNLVNKIVQFYNANIQPEVDSYAFLHERLESSDNVRSTNSGSNTEPYCGLYHGYYYAGIPTRKEVYGAVIRIRRMHDTTSVQMITGITEDMDLNGPMLRALFDEKDISLEKYQAYRNSLEMAKRRTTLYKGMADIAPGVLTIQVHAEDRAGSIIVLRLPLVENMDGQYFGSVGLLTLVSEHELQILKMGVMRADHKELRPFSLQNEQLNDVLSIEKLGNDHIQLRFNDNSLWNDMILASGR